MRRAASSRFGWGVSGASYTVARHVWAGMLWFMRRPRIKRMRRRIWERWPEPARSRIRSSIVRQDRWALRHGLRMLTGLFGFALGCLIVFGTYYLALWVLESGVATMPESLRDGM